MKNRSLLFVLVLNICASSTAQERVLYNFGERQHEGNPYAGVTLKHNRLYGTTGGGTVYELRRSGANWREVVLHEFNRSSTDGGSPESSVIFDSSGNMYGTTAFGGTYDQGTIFMMSRTAADTWTETVLYSFAGGSDGAFPTTQLEFDTVGNLYGTTRFGGTDGGGTVFKLSHDSAGWSESILYSFPRLITTTGYWPYAGVIYREGVLYGTTIIGGPKGRGTVFKLTPSGSTWTYRALHNFGGKDGGEPLARVLFNKGFLYGTTSGGGTHDCGTVFRLNLSSGGLRSFRFDRQGGCLPISGVILDSEDNLYGTTFVGGTNGTGVVFKLHPIDDAWAETVLYSFTGGIDGGFPSPDSLIFGGDHKLYGTTFVGGSHLYGTVFELIF